MNSTKTRNKYWPFIITGLIVLVSLTLIIFFYRKEELRAKQEAIPKAKEFCMRLNIACESPMSFEDRFFYGFFHGRKLAERVSEKDINIFFGRDKMRITHPYIYVSLDKKSGDIVGYSDSGIEADIQNKYRLKRPKAPVRPTTFQPEFMAEDKAKELARSIAVKIPLPEDMVFDRMERDRFRDVWHGYWVRQKDGYRYEGDGAVITIMGATGDFVAYKKISLQRTPSVAEVKVSREKAIEIGWSKLMKHIPKEVRGQAKGIYKVTAELRIIQPKSYWTILRDFIPFTRKESKLAWVIDYYFTGGLVDPVEGKLSYDWTEDERKAAEAYFAGTRKRWEEMSRPPRDVEMRIDAATGKLLQATPVLSGWLRWLIK